MVLELNLLIGITLNDLKLFTGFRMEPIWYLEAGVEEPVKVGSN